MVTAVARRYLEGYDEHPAIQAADAALDKARPVSIPYKLRLRDFTGF